MTTTNETGGEAGWAVETIELGNHEQLSRGVFPVEGGFLAMTFTQSKTFKTRRGAERWLAKRTAR